jgi:hypothetical protein
MTEKEQFDALMKLAEFRRTVREGRRQIEWKLTVTAFVALAGLSIAPIRWWIVLLAAIVVCVLHTKWVLWNMSRNESDRPEMYFYKDLAEKLLPSDHYDLTRTKAPRSLSQQPAAWLQIGTAYGLGIYSIVARLFG